MKRKYRKRCRSSSCSSAASDYSPTKSRNSPKIVFSGLFGSSVEEKAKSPKRKKYILNSVVEKRISHCDKGGKSSESVKSNSHFKDNLKCEVKTSSSYKQNKVRKEDNSRKRAKSSSSKQFSGKKLNRERKHKLSSLLPDRSGAKSDCDNKEKSSSEPCHVSYAAKSTKENHLRIADSALAAWHAASLLDQSVDLVEPMKTDGKKTNRSDLSERKCRSALWNVNARVKKVKRKHKEVVSEYDGDQAIKDMGSSGSSCSVGSSVDRRSIDPSWSVINDRSEKKKSDIKWKDRSALKKLSPRKKQGKRKHKDVVLKCSGSKRRKKHNSSRSSDVVCCLDDLRSAEYDKKKSRKTKKKSRSAFEKLSPKRKMAKRKHKEVSSKYSGGRGRKHKYYSESSDSVDSTVDKKSVDGSESVKFDRHYKKSGLVKQKFRSVLGKVSLTKSQVNNEHACFVVKTDKDCLRSKEQCSSSEASESGSSPLYLRPSDDGGFQKYDKKNKDHSDSSLGKGRSSLEKFSPSYRLVKSQHKNLELKTTKTCSQSLESKDHSSSFGSLGLGSSSVEERKTEGSRSSPCILSLEEGSTALKRTKHKDSEDYQVNKDIVGETEAAFSCSGPLVSRTTEQLKVNVSDTNGQVRKKSTARSISSSDDCSEDFSLDKDIRRALCEHPAQLDSTRKCHVYSDSKSADNKMKPLKMFSLTPACDDDSSDSVESKDGDMSRQVVQKSSFLDALSQEKLDCESVNKQPSSCIRSPSLVGAKRSRQLCSSDFDTSGEETAKDEKRSLSSRRPHRKKVRKSRSSSSLSDETFNETAKDIKLTACVFHAELESSVQEVEILRRVTSVSSVGSSHFRSIDNQRCDQEEKQSLSNLNNKQASASSSSSLSSVDQSKEDKEKPHTFRLSVDSALVSTSSRLPESSLMKSSRHQTAIVARNEVDNHSLRRHSFPEAVLSERSHDTTPGSVTERTLMSTSFGGREGRSLPRTRMAQRTEAASGEALGLRTVLTPVKWLRAQCGSPAASTVFSPRSALRGLDQPHRWGQDLVARSKTYQLTFVDTHCHIDLLYDRLSIDHSTKFSDFQKMVACSFPVNFEGCIAVFCYPKAYDPINSQYQLLRTLKEDSSIWFAIGCHPKNATEFTTRHEEGLRKALANPRVVALGECGLDYSGSFYRHAETQKDVLRKQLKMAVELKLPLVIHCRDAYDDCLVILKEVVPRTWMIHLHCFCGSVEVASLWMASFPNLYIGLTPVITYRSAQTSIRTARELPLSRLLLETDSPYFVPGSIREGRVQVSHPGFALFTAECIAELKGVPVDVVLRACRTNTELVYGV